MNKIIKTTKNRRFKKQKLRLKIRIGERERMILTAIAAGIIVTACVIAPGLPMAFAPFIKRQGKKRFERDMHRLCDKGLISLSGKKIKLTAKGERMREMISLSEMKLKKPREWDGYWRLVSYDIPEYGKKGREYFRYTIEKWGFRKVQKSLWAYPYDCKEEIAVLVDKLNITEYVMYMTTDEMSEEKKWEEYFNL